MCYMRLNIQKLLKVTRVPDRLDLRNIIYVLLQRFPSVLNHRVLLILQNLAQRLVIELGRRRREPDRRVVLGQLLMQGAEHLVFSVDHPVLAPHLYLQNVLCEWLPSLFVLSNQRLGDLHIDAS